MVLKQSYNAIVLCKIIRKTCNGSTVAVEEDVIGSVIEGLFNFMLVR